MISEDFQAINSTTDGTNYCSITVVLENVEHCGGEPEQAATMSTHE